MCRKQPPHGRSGRHGSEQGGREPDITGCLGVVRQLPQPILIMDTAVVHQLPRAAGLRRLQQLLLHPLESDSSKENPARILQTLCCFMTHDSFHPALTPRVSSLRFWNVAWQGFFFGAGGETSSAAGRGVLWGICRRVRSSCTTH